MIPFDAYIARNIFAVDISASIGTGSKGEVNSLEWMGLRLGISKSIKRFARESKQYQIKETQNLTLLRDVLFVYSNMIVKD